METTNKVIEIDLRRLLLALWHRAWIILAVGAVVGMLAFGYAWFFITPTYSASAQLYVNNNYADSPGFSSSQIVAAQNLADTYMVILKSRNVLDDVASQTDLGYSYEQLRGMVRASAINETEVFQVTVTCTDYTHAAIIANAIADVLPDKIAAVVDGSSVRIVDRAVVCSDRVAPSYERYAIIGVLVGCLLTVAVVIVLDIMDTSINSEEYLAQVYPEYPLLAVIPDSENPKASGYYRGHYQTYDTKPSDLGKGAKQS